MLHHDFKLPYTWKFSRYEIFAVHQANRIFAIILSRITYDNFFCGFRMSFYVVRVFCCMHVLPHGCEDLSYYFQRQKDRFGLPNSVPQTCIELLSIRQSDGSKSRGEYIKKLPKIEQSSRRIRCKEWYRSCNSSFNSNRMQRFPSLKETSVRGSTRGCMENAYCKELLSHSSRKRGPVEISELPQKRRGRPLLLGDELETEVKCLLHHALSIANGQISAD